MGELSGRRTHAALDRAERRMAFGAVRVLLDEIPDEVLARIAYRLDGEELAAWGITRPLLESLLGDAEDGPERDRRLKAAFDLPYVRKRRLYELTQEGARDDG